MDLDKSIRKECAEIRNLLRTYDIELEVNK
jgi:hypothetical protein